MPVSLRLRAVRWQTKLLGLGAAALGGDRTVMVDERVEEYRRYWQEAAQILGAEFVPLGDAIWEVRRGHSRTRIANELVQADDPVTLHLAGDKAFCYGLAQTLGIPVPETVVCELASLPAAYPLLGHPLVVKPAEGTSSGQGVTVGVETRRQLERAAALASLRS